MSLRAALLGVLLLSCRSSPAEPVAPAPSAKAAEARPASVHVINAKDHRNLTHLAVGDVVELPHDPEFAWSIKFENGSYFDPAPPSEAGVERYKAARTGVVRSIVSGKPKICMGSDAPCTLAEYAWQINLAVE